MATTRATGTIEPAGEAPAAIAEDAEALRDAVRARYAAAARRVTQTGEAGEHRATCCGPEGDDGHDVLPAAAGGDPITTGLYADDETRLLPQEAVLASLGCGNPTALAELHPGEIVLDLGSGGGIDVLLSARRVGPTGFAYGLDMTDEMLALAEANRRKAGATNVEFLKGTIEQIPLPDNSVDVVISNCVINLAADKDAVLREAFRVLKPGGRFAVSDIVVRTALPERVLRSIEAWAGCVAGALHEREYVAKLAAAGFGSPEVQITRTFGLADLEAWTGEADGVGSAACCGVPEDVTTGELRAAEGAIASAFIRATKPTTA